MCNGLDTEPQRNAFMQKINKFFSTHPNQILTIVFCINPILFVEYYGNVIIITCYNFFYCKTTFRFLILTEQSSIKSSSLFCLHFGLYLFVNY